MWGVRDVSVNPVAPVAWVSLADAKAFLGISDASQDARVTALIGVACAAIEAFCADIIASRSVTETVWLEDAVSTLALRYSGVTALTSLTKDGAAEDLSNIRLMPVVGMLRRNDRTVFEPAKWDAAYISGFTAGTEPAPLVEATKMLVRAVYQAKGLPVGVTSEAVDDIGSVNYGEGATVMSNGVSLPLDVASLLGPYMVQVAP